MKLFQHQIRNIIILCMENSIALILVMLLFAGDGLYAMQQQYINFSLVEG